MATAKLKILYHVFFEEFGEYDAFFDKAGKLVDYWHCNDASWRSGYMDGVVGFFGGSVKNPGPLLLAKCRKAFIAELKDNGQWDDEAASE